MGGDSLVQGFRTLDRGTVPRVCNPQAHAVGSTQGIGGDGTISLLATPQTSRAVAGCVGRPIPQANSPGSTIQLWVSTS